MVCGRRASIPVGMCLGLRKGPLSLSHSLPLSPRLSFSIYRFALVLFPRVSFASSVAVVGVRKYRLSLKVNGRNRELHVRARSGKGDASAGVQDGGE